MRALALAALLALAACGTVKAEPAPPRYQADATVLESPEHGPQLCRFAALSLPPQCGGPDVVGWDWAKVPHESRAGTKWGRYHVVGTWDGSRLTLTEPPRPAENKPAQPPRPTTPCPTPEGGWKPVDPAKATPEAMEAVQRRAMQAGDFAGLWLDQSYLEQIPGYDSSPEMAEKYANDPKKLVVNVRFTGDVAAREAWLREVWGGALCVTRAERTEAELRAIQERAQQEIPGVTDSSADVVSGKVDVGVWVATGELQRQVDEKFGTGVVRLHAFLTPVP
ncbi:hypothetical protein [Thermoactinospora rubra]|uniref:hypothetical protein n=1 Tax=Thermoactinospora rubra TaxID=1088767 RepID=UPI000A11EA3E|nr:hypothetical protein [Thermoactinospora rubra]